MYKDLEKGGGGAARVYVCVRARVCICVHVHARVWFVCARVCIVVVDTNYRV